MVILLPPLQLTLRFFKRITTTLAVTSTTPDHREAASVPNKIHYRSDEKYNDGCCNSSTKSSLEQSILRTNRKYRLCKVRPAWYEDPKLCGHQVT